MKLCILYHPNSEHSRSVESFAEECKKASENDVELLSLESREGASLANLYSVLDYPALLVLREDGQLLKGWQGAALPMINDVMGVLNS